MAENHQVFLYYITCVRGRWKSGGLPLNADRNEV